jgi:hypothetical protein
MAKKTVKKKNCMNAKKPRSLWVGNTNLPSAKTPTAKMTADAARMTVKRYFDDQ